MARTTKKTNYKQMKKILFASLFFATFVAQAQQIQLTEGQPTIVYSLPKTEIQIEISVEKINIKPGIYYQYANRYLAVDDVQTTESTSYRLVNAIFKTQTVADPKRTYAIEPAKKSVLNQLSINKNGILCGINISTRNLFLPPVSTHYNADNAPKASILPLGEEYMMAGSISKLAEGAAKQIYRIRESRLGLLTGDVEHMPADGKSLQTMLEGLDKAEKELTALFMGKATTTIERKLITIPSEGALKNHVAFRLSAFKGIVDSDDLSGAPYFVNLSTAINAEQRAAAKKTSEQINIYTLIPAKANVELTDGVQTICSLQTDLPQLGVSIPLSAEILSIPGAKISIDPSNGRLLSVENSTEK